MNPTDEPIHIIIRLPYARPEGFVDTQPIQWTDVMEKTLWQIIGQTKPSLVDWNAVSRQLGKVPVPFLIRHAAFLYQNQLQDLHRIGEQQDLTAQLQANSRPTSRGHTGPAVTSLETHLTRSPSSTSLQQAQRDSSSADISHASANQGAYRDRGLSLGTRDGPLAGLTSGYSNASVQQQQEAPTKTQASPSLSGIISTFPTTGKPASMSSSASTIRPLPPSSPSPSLRNTTASSHQPPSEGNLYNSGVLSNRGSAQPRSTRGSQLIGSSLDRRPNYLGSTLPTSPQEEGSFSEVGGKRIPEPAHPFHHATLSASMHLSETTPTVFTQSPSLPARSNADPAAVYRSPFQDNDPSSTISSVSTPYSQSNSASQIFEETSFFNQLSSNDSLSRGHHQQQQQQQKQQHQELSGHGGDYSFGQEQGGYGLGFMGVNSSSSSRYNQANRHSVDDDDDDDDQHTDQDDEGESHDESGPLSEQIKQLHLEDVLAFLPIGGGTGGNSVSGVFQKPMTTATTTTTEDGYQRRTASGDKMPFQLDDELANLGTRALEEILENDGGDEEEAHRVRGIRFQDNVGPHRIRGLGREGAPPSKLKTSPERSAANSRKSSAQNSVGSSFSDLSDSSVTQSAMEDAYLSGFNNSKISLFMHASTKN
ncbi:hypothetical protein EC968_007051 [Mortierella alpina]|nr:hypothetical protein EC968_007051 [Mortierella alpina]